MKSLEKRISEKLTKKDGTIKLAFRAIYDVIDNPTSTFRIHEWAGSGRHLSLRSLNGDIVNALNLVGIDFEIKNDAPKGGKNGDYISLTTKGKRQVSGLMKKRAAQMEIRAAKQNALLASIKAKQEAEMKERQEKFNEIAKGVDSPEYEVINFFLNEAHPAPARVVAAKEMLGMSWNQLRANYKV